jgi:hypothetical protein
LQLRRAGQRRPELLVVLAAHPLEKVQILRAEHSDPGHGGAGQHLVGQQGGARQRMRSAARDADRVAAIGAEMGKDRGGIGGAVGHRPAGLA